MGTGLGGGDGYRAGVGTSDPTTTPGDGEGPVWCVVVAAGSGRRFGGAKQFAELAGRRVLDRSVATAAEVCDGVVVVLAPDVVDSPEGRVPGATAVVAGGATRTESGRAGLAAVPPEAEVVLVHDAARPLADAALFTRVIDAVRGGAAAVVPVVAVTDTVRDVGGAPVDRERLRAVQTPQGFDAAVLRAAMASGAEATDDAGLVEAAGGRVTFVEGDPSNRKLTTPEDLLVARALLAGRDEAVTA